MEFLNTLLIDFGYVGLMMLALKITVGVAFTAAVFGLGLAFLGVYLALHRCCYVRYFANVLMMMIRSLPEILVVFIVVLGMPHLWYLISGNYPQWSLFWLSVIALSFIYAAYASQTLRGALLAVSNSQWESGAVLGLSRLQTFISIIFPQMLRHALPGLGNQWLVLLKDTALVFLIGLHDVMAVADSAFNATQQPFTWYSIAALIYLSVTLCSQYVQRRIEYYFNIHE